MLSPQAGEPARGPDEPARLDAPPRDGAAFLDTAAGLFADPAGPSDPAPDSAQRPGTSLFAWRGLFRS